jgi:DNA-3-methyladenine glycosylase II
MKDHIIAHFKKSDPILFEYIAKVNVEDFTKHNDLFVSLCDEIISQQLSGKAAETIFQRFKKLFPNEEITAKTLSKIPEEAIRAAGCSWAKVRSLKDLADHVLTKKLHLEKLDTLADEEVIKELVQVKGIGPWTAEMFMMFTLGREDIFSHGDLGLKKAIQRMYGFKKEPTINQVEKLLKKWSPYKTYAARILWKSLDIKD